MYVCNKNCSAKISFDSNKLMTNLVPAKHKNVKEWIRIISLKYMKVLIMKCKDVNIYDKQKKLLQANTEN